jgi:hypothetical protein
LKDAAGLVKMYAFVDVAQYQIVGTGVTIDEARHNYRMALNLEDEIVTEPENEMTASGTVESVADVVVSGNSCYYFMLEGDSRIYTALITVSEQLPFLRTGDKVSFTYTPSGEDGDTGNVNSIEITEKAGEGTEE